MTDHPFFPYTETQLAWLIDLETTDAGQTSSVLRDADGFCCLGRACEVVSEQLGLPWTTDMTSRYVNFSFDKESSILPDSVADAFHLIDSTATPDVYPMHSTWKWDGSSPLLNNAGVYQILSLPKLNDDANLSFKQIADHIRRFPHFYFDNDGPPDLKGTYAFLAKPFDEYHDHRATE